MSNIVKYIENLELIIKEVKATQLQNIEKAATAVAKALKKDNFIYAFGTGHSHMLSEEMFYRAGGMVRVYPIFCTELMLHAGAVKSTAMERLTSYAEIILNDYPVKRGDVIFIFSNSGRNSVSIEMALHAKQKGMTVIALTNMDHSLSSASRHSTGKRLFELADIVIDNCGEKGDACIQIKDRKIAPTSSSIGAMIVNAIVARTAEILENENVTGEFFSSSNTDDGEKLNQKYIDKYKEIIKPL